MSDSRKEFEKLDGVVKLIKNGVHYNERFNYYQSIDGISYLTIARINGAWFAFQEQQKNIDAIKSKLSDIYDACDENGVCVLLDEIQELNK